MYKKLAHIYENIHVVPEMMEKPSKSINLRTNRSPKEKRRHKLNQRKGI